MPGALVLVAEDWACAFLARRARVLREEVLAHYPLDVFAGEYYALAATLDVRLARLTRDREARAGLVESARWHASQAGRPGFVAEID